MNNPRWKTALLLSLVLLISALSGCGFHLVGLQNKEPVSLFLDYGQISATFRQEFKQVLSESALIVQPVELAESRVVFIKEHWQRQSLSVSDTGIPAEYRLRYTLVYRYKKQGIEKTNEISESRDFKSNNAQLLAIESEQSLLKRQIQQSVARRVIRAIN